MKVVLTVPAYFPESFGGGETYVRRLAAELVRREHAVTVVTVRDRPDSAEGGRLERYEHAGIQVLAVRHDPRELGHSEAYVGDGPVIRAALREVFEDLRPDLVHANGLKPPTSAVCEELGVPCVVTAHHAGIACANGTLLCPDGQVCSAPMSAGACVPCANVVRRPRWGAGRLLGTMPRFLYAPVGRRLEARRHLSYLQRGLVHPWLVEQSILAKRAVFDRAAALVAPSQAMRSLLLRNGCDERKVHVVPHGVEPLEKTPLGPFDGRPVRFGYVGRVDPLKGLGLLMDALAALPTAFDWELHVFGAARSPRDERYRSKLQRDHPASARVRFHGLVDSTALDGAFHGFDVLVVPSLLPEAFGLVVLESFSAGRPVVVSRVGALPELVRDGVDGVVVERDDRPALAAVLKRLVAEPAVISGMAANLPSVLTLPRHVDRLLVAYDLARASRGRRGTCQAES